MDMKTFNKNGYKLIEHDIVIRESVVDTTEMENEPIHPDMSFGTSDVRDEYTNDIDSEALYTIEDANGVALTSKLIVEDALIFIKTL